MKTLTIILFAILLSSCTSYTVKREFDPNTGVLSTEVKVRSTRDLEQPVVKYARTGADATFDFQAASVDNNTEAMLGLFTGMMNMMMQVMQANMEIPQ
jgi:hypothetical protein